MKRIIFWDTVHNTMGGMEKIILTLTHEFSKSRKVLVISKPKSVVLKILSESGASFDWLLPDEEILKTSVSRNDLLIVFYVFNELKFLKQPNPNMLIWNVYPTSGNPNVLKKWRTTMMIKKLMRLNSIVTMDNECNSAFLKQYGIRLSNDYLKIPINVKRNCYKYKTDKKLINITYVGRGDDIWKIKPVKKLIKDLSSVKSNFLIHIFTDTADLFKGEFKELSSQNIEVKYYFQYWGEKLSEKLIELSDLHYSMGTSMLEGASLGIPTIIADAGMYDFPDSYKYRWFIDDVDNYAGNFIDGKEFFSGCSINEIVNKVFNKNSMEKLSQIQHDYVCETYSSSKIADKITDWHPKACVKTILKYYPRMWL